MDEHWRDQLVETNEHVQRAHIPDQFDFIVSTDSHIAKSCVIWDMKDWVGVHSKRRANSSSDDTGLLLITCRLDAAC
jgi:hypothetical protein